MTDSATDSPRLSSDTSEPPSLCSSFSVLTTATTTTTTRKSREPRLIPRVELKPGLNSFDYIDPLGRVVPVYYFMPSEYPTAPVEQLQDTIADEEDEDEVVSKPDASDLAEEVAEDESDVEDEVVDDDSVVTTVLENAVEREEDEPVSKKEQDLFFESELFTSQDIIFVMHGVLRDAKQYCKQWSKHARRFNVLVVCPEFNVKNFPQTWDYNLGAMRKGSKDDSSFMAIERIFEILNNSGVRRKGYHLYGHSAGSQFAHRFVLFMPKQCHLVSTIAANAGWYTLPVKDTPYNFPYSLRRAPWPVNERQLLLAFSRRLCIMLGQEDNEMTFLRRTQPAMLQGGNRFERGINFYLTAKKVAESMKADFNWYLKTVPRTGHVNRRMALAAVKELFAVPPTAIPPSIANSTQTAGAVASASTSPEKT